MSVPCSVRIDVNTIMADPVIGPAIKSLAIELIKDEELVMGLYFMRQRVLWTDSPVYHSLVTATPPDLAMNWDYSEIAHLQDRTTIESVLMMRKEMDAKFEDLYPRLVSTGTLGIFSPDLTWSQEEFKQFFQTSFHSAATRYIQYEYHLKHMTYMPIIECSNFTPDKKPPLYQCVDSRTGEILTECELGYPSCYGIPGLEVHLGRSFEEVKKQIPKIVSEREFDQYDDQTFYFVPEDHHRMRLVATEPLMKGEQMPYHYGWCSNRFFLINYGFCMPNNPMDAVSIRLKDASGEDKIVLLHRNSSQKKFLALCTQVLRLSMPLMDASQLRLPTLTYALGLLQSQYQFDFTPTPEVCTFSQSQHVSTLAQDKKLLEEKAVSGRVRQALEYRIYLKEVYEGHIQRLTLKIKKCIQPK